MNRGRICGAEEPGDRDWPYRCTRRAGHEPVDHQATAFGGIVLATWPAEKVR